jgi:hypothetical protein
MPKLTTKLTRIDFQTLAETRLRDARLLFGMRTSNGIGRSWDSGMKMIATAAALQRLKRAIVSAPFRG